MSSQEKESYKDYLVRTVTQEIGNIFNQKGALSVAGQIMDSDFYLKETRRTTCK